MGSKSAFKVLQVAAIVIAGFGLWSIVSTTPLMPPAPGHAVRFRREPPASQGRSWAGARLVGQAAGASVASGGGSTRGSEAPLATPDPLAGTFRPGSLAMNRTEAMMHCYVDPHGPYQTHLGDALCTLSEKHKMLFFHVRKSGSSTGRAVTAKAFQARDNMRCRAPKFRSYYSVAFVRNPITRFFAQYEEMFVRTLGRDKPSPPARYNVFHNDIDGYKEYERMFCGANKRKQGRVKPCDQIPSQDTGELAHRFERFVEAWDGNVFEAHLAMQAPILTHRDGTPFKLDFIGETRHTIEHWKEVARRLGVPESSVQVMRGRGYPRRMNVSYIGKSTYERICRLAAIDFCCLNFELPPECIDSGVSCRWEEREGSKRIVPELAPRP